MTLQLILAQEGGAGAGGGLGMMVPMILIMVMFYFVLIRPQRNQAKKLEEMRNNLGIGDQVVTAGGIHGIITGQTKATVSVKVADGLSLKFDRASIATISSSKGKGESVDDLPDEEDDEAEDSHGAVVKD